MKVDRDKIIKFCEEYLKVKDFQDQCVNGLQVEGEKNISKIVTGVTLSQKFIKEAIKRKPQMIMVHHGIFAMQIGNPPKIKNFIKDRIKLLLENDLNLAGFHLSLDAHPIIGNNISLCKVLGIVKTKPLDDGFVGELKKPVLSSEFVKLIDKKLSTKSQALLAGPKFVKKVGVLSGGASRYLQQFSEEGIDTYITGDIAEPTVSAAEELKINFINAGHYNTEKMGIQNLGNLIAKKFRVEVEFVDTPCEV
jgi:dinuclear metal center YbgI/SA1388 family protein